MELTAEHLRTLRKVAEIEVKDPEGKGWVMLQGEVLLALVDLAGRFMAEVPFVSEELVTAKGTEGTIPVGATQHFERRDDGFYVVWGADGAYHGAGEIRINNWVLAREWERIDPASQALYIDRRTRPEGAAVNEVGRCRECYRYIPARAESEEAHDCEGGQYERGS